MLDVTMIQQDDRLLDNLGSARPDVLWALTDRVALLLLMWRVDIESASHAYTIGVIVGM